MTTYQAVLKTHYAKVACECIIKHLRDAEKERQDTGDIVSLRASASVAADNLLPRVVEALDELMQELEARDAANFKVA